MGRDFRPRTEDREERFAHVFTKLQGLGLTDYEKVLMMDIDLLVRDSIGLAWGRGRKSVQMDIIKGCFFSPGKSKGNAVVLRLSFGLVLNIDR